MKFKAVIFDIDGTLVDSLGVYAMAFNNGVGKFGLAPVSVRELAEALNEGMRLNQIISLFYPERRDDGFVASCHNAVINAFRDIATEQTPLLPGTETVLSALSAIGLPLGIATGRTTPAEEVWLWLNRVGIGEYFQAVVTSADVAQAKPAPDCILECARRLRVPAPDCLVVGDSTSDVVAARSAGAAAVAVLTGVAGRAILAASEPMAIVSDLHELLSFVT